MSRIMYAEITALSHKDGYCSAGNEYFAKLYDVSTVTVSRWVSKLGKRGHISIDADPVTGHNRKLYPLNKNVIPHNKNVKAPIQKDQGGLNKNVKHNSTSIILQDNSNSANSTNVELSPTIADEYSFDAFWDKYANKKDKKKSKVSYNRLSKANKKLCIDAIKRYDAFLAQPENAYRQKLSPRSWITGERWDDDWSSVNQSKKSSTLNIAHTGRDAEYRKNKIAQMNAYRQKMTS